MKKINWPIILLILDLGVIIFALLKFMNFSYPRVGHDYSLAVPFMLDTYQHYRVNGLFSLQWYTPSFGGGLPVYPDPNFCQYALFALLTLIFAPWQAVMLSTAIYILLGGATAYYLFRGVLKFHWTSSLLGMVFFLATGFYMERMAAGHMGYQTFPLLIVFLITLLDPSLPRGIAGLLCAAAVAVMLQSASYFMLVVFALSIFVTLPLIYIFKPAVWSWKRLLSVLALGGAAGLILSASKIAAVVAFMRFFPRSIADTFNSGIFQGLLGIICQLLGTMTLVPVIVGSHVSPLALLNFLNYLTGSNYGYWEYDMSVTPVALFIVFLGLYGFLRRPRQHLGLFTRNRNWIAWIVFLCSTWLTIEFILAKGIVYPLLKDLPGLSSLHVNARYTAAAIFPIVLVAVVLYDATVINWSGKARIASFAIVNVLALLPLASFFMTYDMVQRTYDLSQSESIYASLRAGKSFTVTDISDRADDTQALASHASNLTPYDPIFGYYLENFHPEIQPGSIWTVQDGYYNMTNPAGYVFPEINGTRPFERIPVSQKAQLEAFAAHRQAEWKLPLYQVILDWVSGLSCLLVALILAAYFVHRRTGLLPKLFGTVSART